MTTMLYDAPGPRARRRNAGYTVLFGLVLVAVGYFVYTQFDSKDQWSTALWSPFLRGSTWSQFILPGLVNTIKAAVLAVLIALPIGALLGVGRLSEHWWVRRPAGAVVEFFRAIPVLILMVFAAEFYFSYTNITPEQRPLFAVVTGLVLYNGSVLAEVVRAGILSLPRGQTEAAMALGLRKTQIMTTILLPQAVKIMLPAIVSQLVVVLKDTALGGQLTIGYTELVRSSGPLTANFGNTIPTLIVIAIIFIVLNFVLTTLASALERRLSRRGRPPRGVKPTAVEPQPTHITTDLETGV